MMRMKFLHTQGKKIVDSDGKEVLLSGWGLGNWLLQEGYMWKAYTERFDRPARIEKCIEELAGKEYAASFWRRYRENYVRREDIFAMKELGYNSVRIPFSYRHFMEDGPGITWKEEGFALLDRCLMWCEEAQIYAFLDLHGAPGGQTGSNIDDSVDNVPRLFVDEDCYEKALALWEKLAQRYCGRAVVGGYDLLNEPIVPPEAGNGDFDVLIPKLERFYEDAAARIRKVDAVHILSLEGPHWAADVRIFHKKYDDNMVLHFHRYAEMPDIACLERYIDAADRLDVPLWMGETGENKNTWYAALYPLSQKLSIGYNLWPWKKMDCTNSPCSVREPEGYQEILSYLERGPHPGFLRAQRILDEYLENVRYENCDLNPAVTNHVFRKVPFMLCAVDFDELPGKGVSFSGTGGNSRYYRKNTGMEICELYPPKEKEFAFDCGWDRLALVLSKGEFACYSFTCKKEDKLQTGLSFTAGEDAVILLRLKNGQERTLAVGKGMREAIAVFENLCPVTEQETLRVEVKKGKLTLERLRFF